MFSLICNLLKMDAYSNGFQKIFRARSFCDCKQISSHQIAASVMLCAIYIFNESKMCQKDISKRTHYFIFQKHIKISATKFCPFSIHWNCIEKVNQNEMEFLAIKITLKKVHLNDINFSPISRLFQKILLKEHGNL